MSKPTKKTPYTQWGCPVCGEQTAYVPVIKEGRQVVRLGTAAQEQLGPVILRLADPQYENGYRPGEGPYSCTVCGERYKTPAVWVYTSAGRTRRDP